MNIPREQDKTLLNSEVNPKSLSMPDGDKVSYALVGPSMSFKDLTDSPGPYESSVALCFY